MQNKDGNIKCARAVWCDPIKNRLHVSRETLVAVGVQSGEEIIKCSRAVWFDLIRKWLHVSRETWQTISVKDKEDIIKMQPPCLV